MLKQSEIAFYEENGYVIPDWRLPKQDVDALRGALDTIIAENPDRRPEQLVSAHLTNNESGVKGHEAFLNLAFHKDIVAMVSDIAGEDLILWGCHIFCKPAGNGHAVPWHQDGHYWPIHPLATTSVWLAIDESVTENGCLCLVPGSHKGEVLHPHMNEDRPDQALDEVITQEAYNEAEVVNIELQPGELSIHDCYMIHGSAPNVSTKRRAGVALRYMPASSLFDRTEKATRTTKAGLTVDYRNRPLWLVSGVDRHGGNGPFEVNPRV